jgi:hypothetical protein
LALREILKYPEVRRVTLVDIDQEMVNLASRLPVLQTLNRASFADPRVRVAIEDAFMFVRRAAAGHDAYDVIIVDFPDAVDETLARLYSRDFYRLVRRILNPDGIAAIQSTFFLTFPHRTIFTTVKAAGFASVAAYRPRDTVNAVTIAGMHSDLLPALDRFEVPVPSATMRSRKDISRVIAHGRIAPYEWADIQANSMFWPTILKNPDHPSLWRHYLRPALMRWLRRRPTPAPVSAPGGCPLRA